MSRKIKITVYIILVLILSLSIIQLTSCNKSTVSKNLEDLNIKQLVEFRDKSIDKNLEKHNNLEKDYKDKILNSDYGLNSFVNNNYKNLSEKYKLIKQIKIIEYLNSTNEKIDPSGDFFKIANEDYQLNEYLLKNKKNPDLTLYENLKFMINNLEDLCNFIDYNSKDLLYNINSLIQLNLSQEQKTSLNNELKKIYSDKNTSQEIKNNIKEVYSYN